MGNIIFGPVPSRRFGKSLGIDLFPDKKSCSFNCIYCEVGEGKPIKELNEFVSVEEVVSPLFKYLNQNTDNLPDFITFAGSGEPTLHPEIDQIIDGIKEMTDIPVVLLTNGSFFHKKEYRSKVLNCDYLVPSLDAGFEKSYLKINRPCKSFKFDELVAGLIEMRKEFKGTYILEILLVGGINTSIEEFNELKKLAEKIDPEFIQINTVFRPPAVDGVRAALESEKNMLASIIGNKATMVEYYKRKKTSSHLRGKLLESTILNTVKIRPGTFSELSDSLSADKDEMEKIVKNLIKTGILKEKKFNNEIYFEMNTKR